MKVLHLISRYRWTGSAEPAATLCRHLELAGADSLLCCVPGGSLEREARERGVRLLPAARLGRDYTPWGILRAARDLARTVERERIDLLHAHTSHDHWLAALGQMLFSRRPVPLFRTHHETRKIRAGRVWRRIFNHHTALNLVPSQWARDFFAGRGAIRPDRLRVVHGGLDFERFRTSAPPPDVRGAWGIPRGAPVVAHLSHIGPDRRQDLMLEAFGEIAGAHPGAWLAFLGQGNRSTVSRLREAIRRRTFASRVVFSKDFARAGIPWPDQVAATDLVVVLAVGSEGSSRGVMEAMALGRPVIGARVGVIPELIEAGTSGWLVEPAERGDLAARLREALADPERSARRGEAGAERIRSRFRVERQAREVLDLYREALAPARGTGSR